MSRPQQSTTGWPASCLSLPISEYIKLSDSPTWPGCPVSADAEAHMRIAHISNYIAGRMLKIDRVSREELGQA